MHHFCTVADSSFRSRVLALNYSLKKYSNNYKLHLLCLDNEIYSTISDLNIKAYLLSDLLNNDTILLESKNNTPSREALHNAQGNIDKAKNIQFIWSLAPYFSNYCLNNNPTIDSILYIDSDIYFFNNWEKIYDYTSNINIGLVEHRIKHYHNNGKYNVGIVYFKNNDIGLTCSTLWKDLLLYTDHQFYSLYGDCGDQKYLELFPNLFNGVESFDKFFGHLAPWNFNYHTYTDNEIIWEDKKQYIMYCHFSNFNPNFKEDTYIPAPRHGIVSVSKNQLLKKLYDEYYTILKGFEQ